MSQFRERHPHRITVTIDLSPAQFRCVTESAEQNGTTSDEVIGLVARIGISEQIEQFGSPELQAALRDE